MFRKVLVATSITAVGALAAADVTPSWQLVYEGYLSDGVTYVYSLDLRVSVPAGDAWTVAGGPVVGEPWIRVWAGATFYQSPMNDGNPPDPDFFQYFPDSEYTSFYTTHLGYPNTPDQGVSPGFAFGPDDTDQALTADWFWTPDSNDYPGEFTIARTTIIVDDPESWACAEIDMLIGSREGQIIPYSYSWGSCCFGDLDRDRDRDVDLSDLAQLLANYGTTSGATYWDGDLDEDGDVDLDDLGELLSVYGVSCPWWTE